MPHEVATKDDISSNHAIKDPGQRRCGCSNLGKIVIKSLAVGYDVCGCAYSTSTISSIRKATFGYRSMKIGHCPPGGVFKKISSRLASVPCFSKTLSFRISSCNVCDLLNPLSTSGTEDIGSIIFGERNL